MPHLISHTRLQKRVYSFLRHICRRSKELSKSEAWSIASKRCVKSIGQSTNPIYYFRKKAVALIPLHSFLSLLFYSLIDEWPIQAARNHSYLCDFMATSITLYTMIYQEYSCYPPFKQQSLTLITYGIRLCKVWYGTKRSTVKV